MKRKLAQSERSWLGAVVLSLLALVAVTVTNLVRAGSQERERLTERRDDLKRHIKWLLVVRTVWKHTRLLRAWLPVVVTLLTWHAHLKHALSRVTHTAD